MGSATVPGSNSPWRVPFLCCSGVAPGVTSEHGGRQFLCCSHLPNAFSILVPSCPSVPHSPGALATGVRVYQLVAPKLCEGGCPSFVNNFDFAKRTQSRKPS